MTSGEQTGDQPPGGDPPSFSGDQPSVSGDQPSVSGDQPSFSGDQPSESRRPGPSGERPSPIGDPAAILQSMLPGLAWSQAMIEGPARAQAAMAAETLRQLNAPMRDALAWQRELAESLATMADQMTTVAEQMQQLARQHQALTEQLNAATEPYLRYVEWLGQLGAGGT